MNFENENTDLSEISDNEINYKSNDSDSVIYETKRTIDEVMDKETGEIIKAVDFFKKPESEIIQFRRRLAEAISGYALPKYVCSYCGQLLKLSGKQTRRGNVSFFAHLHDSDDCEIKTNGEFTKEEIEIRKYANIRESQRHIDLKNEIANALEGDRSKETGLKNVEIEKRITSNVPYLYWKQPDIFAEFDDKNIVFELQLSTTFLSAIIDRDIFYRLNKTFIIWIFNFSDNQEYVNLSNLMCKDIYYSNKRNAFVFDNKARELSKKEKELVLLCIWFEPFTENGIFNPEKSIKKEEYIRLSDLKFDEDTFKPYYIDADSMFFKYQPELRIYRLNLEQLNISRIKKVEKRRLDKEYSKNSKENKISKLKELIKKGELKLNLFSKKDKYGFECNGITIVEPTYNEAIIDSKYGYFKVKKNNKFGLIDFQGDLILDCNFKELVFIFENKCIVNEKNEWFCIDIRTKSKDFLHKSKVKDSIIDLEKVCEVAFILRIEDTVGILHNKYHFRKYDFINRFIDGVALAKRGGYWKNGYSTHNGRYWEYTSKEFIEGRTVYLDETGEEKIQNVVEIKNDILKGTKFEMWGVETRNKTTIIPFEFNAISEFINNKAKAKKNGNWGFIDEQGKTIIQFEFDVLNEFIDHKAKASKNGNWGFIDEQGEAIIPFEYNVINEFVDNKAKAKKNGYWGFIDNKGKTIIPFVFDEIGEFVNNKTKAKKNGFWGYIDEQVNTIIPFEYIEIGEFINGKAKIKKNGLNGLTDENGNGFVIFKKDKSFTGNYGEKIENFKFGIQDLNNNVILPAIYDKIEEFVDDRAKAYKDKKFIGGNRWSPEYSYNTGYIDIYGNEIIDNAIELESGLIKGEKFGKWGIQSKSNEIVVKFEYEVIHEYINGKAKVKKNNNWGYIDNQGNIIIPIEYSKIEDFIDGRAKAIKKGLNGMIDENGNELIENITEIENGLLKGKKFDKWGILSKKNEIITPFEYSVIDEFINGIAKACKNEMFGYIDLQGHIIIPFEYSEIGSFSDGKAKARRGSSYYQKYGYINDKGKIIIPFVFDKIGDFIDGKALAVKDKVTITIDEQGNDINSSVYIVNSTHKGKITNIVEYGLFVLLENSKTALLHISELKKHNKTCSNFSLGSIIEVTITNVNKEKNRISLTLT